MGRVNGGAGLAKASHRTEGPDRSRQAAIDLARHNGGFLMGFRDVEGVVEVTVRVGRARATVRAMDRARPIGDGVDP
ncbi:MAG: hypothetical protein CL466_12255 [Acidimicrobiaceae bacterium]|nr:hypothetical protein [Acidimicrobiaceae bacterium]